MTYNIRNGRGADGRVDLERIAEVVRPYGPHVLALQEVDVCRARSGGVDQAAELAARLGLHATFAACVIGAHGEGYGLATLSRWPVDAQDVMPEPGNWYHQGKDRVAAVWRRLKRLG